MTGSILLAKGSKRICKNGMKIRIPIKYFFFTKMPPVSSSLNVHYDNKEKSIGQEGIFKII